MEEEKRCRCIYCKRSDTLIKYAGYKKEKISVEKNIPKFEYIYVPRMYCKYCKSTFIVLTKNQLKNYVYDLNFILTVVDAYFKRVKETVIHFCERFQIAVSTLYRWKKMYGNMIEGK